MKSFPLKSKRLPESAYLKGVASACPFIFLLAILAVAFFFRVYGIDFGLPYIYHPDEPSIVNRALSMLHTGDFSPHWFNWPSLYIYIQALVYFMRYLYSAGQAIGFGDVQMAGFYLWGRFTTAVLGTMSVGLTYWVGKKVFDRRVGLLGALFLTFSLLHVESSHYITPDVPTAFFALITFLISLSILEKGETKYYILGGLLAGLTTATKYQGALVFSCIFFAYIIRLVGGKREYQKILYSIIALVFGFLIGVPYALVEAPTFLKNVYTVISHYNLGHLSAEGSANWWWYLTYFYREGMGRGILILSLCGLVMVALKSNARKFISLVFVIVVFGTASSTRARFARNLMPILPFLTLFAAFFLSFLLRWSVKLSFLKGRKLLQVLVPAAVIAALLFTPARNVWNWTHKAASETDARTLAKEWIETHIPEGTVIAGERYTAILNANYEVVGIEAIAKRNIDWYREQRVSYVMTSGGYERYLTRWRLYPYYIYVANYEEMLLYHLELVKQIGWIKIYRIKPAGTDITPRH